MAAGAGPMRTFAASAASLSGSVTTLGRQVTAPERSMHEVQG